MRANKDLYQGINFVSVLLATLIILMIWFVNFNPSMYEISDDSERWDHFGGFLSGTIGSILQLFTIYLLVHSIRLQKQELDDILASQKASGFENTFFNLLLVHHDIVKSISGYISNKSRMYSGREYFDRLVNYLATLSQESNSPSAVETYFQDRGFLYDHFANNFSVMITLVENHKEDHNNEDMYIDILRSQLSLQEKIILAYISTIDDNHKPLKNKLIKYKFIKRKEIGYDSISDSDSYIIKKLLDDFVKSDIDKPNE